MCGKGGMHGRGTSLGCVHGIGAVHGCACPPPTTAARYYEIRSMSGRYASYWNVFLFYFNFCLYCRGAHDHYVGLDSSWFSFHCQSFYESLSESHTGKFHMLNCTLNQLIKILVRQNLLLQRARSSVPKSLTAIIPMLKCSVTTNIRLLRAISFRRLCIFLPIVMVHSHCSTLRP